MKQINQFKYFNKLSHNYVYWSIYPSVHNLWGELVYVNLKFQQISFLINEIVEMPHVHLLFSEDLNPYVCETGAD